MKEQWKDIEGYQGLTEVSDKGKIKHLAKTRIAPNGGEFYYPERISKGYKNKGGYYYITLSKNGGYIRKRINRLVALAFIPNPENKKEVNHKNGKKWDNRKVNLEWNTSSENQIHAFKTGLQKITWAKPVIQFNIDGKKIKEYTSASQAAKKLKISIAGISMAANGIRNKSGGFIWKYKNKS